MPLDLDQPNAAVVIDGRSYTRELLNGGVGWLECEVVPEAQPQQCYDLFLAEVVAAWANPRVFNNGRWTFADDRDRTIHYIAGGNFVTAITSR